ncbi:MAG: HD domain-containing protein [candidate division KSB1 bacterium]|nr:HD domain-containing protein [candidate division KSB1 bacterium]MDZ7272808.1 HD domain-containing protein [candidate division KSB1 bacterium]MDZ7284168.1 HD domain-containing protein [candidate division KSB1 bacterium]MDZ7297434.1 HD domain-containing protein [candidate division KSB1 bacterium]MDZ7308182.1 HD domain-containing protein [candidate division KSB1 bacterium]
MKQLNELLLGEHVTTFVVLRRKETRTKKNGDPYLALELSDATSHVAAVMWDNLESMTAEAGQIVKIAGVVEEYQGQRQVRIDKMRPARDDDKIDLTRLVPSAREDRGVMWERFQKLIESVAQPSLLALLRRVFTDEKITRLFCLVPAGKKWHHGYLGGLLEHTLNVATICDRLAKIYPQVDRDLLVTAALLHDVGKVLTYTPGPVFEYTDAGRLLGHIVMGVQLVGEKLAELSAFPAELAMKLQHLILSHQGTLAQASPVVPMIPEGFLLYFADEIDSKLNAIERIAQKERPAGSKWSEYVNLLERYLYLGEPSHS